MHANGILQKCFADVFTRMHAGRVQVLVGAVLALIASRRLVLMDLARAWPGADRVRAPLKRLDRLLSNAHVQAERVMFYEQMMRWVVRSAEPVIIVDWSTLKSDERWHLLRAALAVGGRTVTLYEEIHPQRKAQSPRVHSAFLKRLKQLLPPRCRPIIVTDAGFRCPWFIQVQALGWHWVGRVRNRVYVKPGEYSPWRLTATLLSTARKLRVFGCVQLVRRKPFECQLLRYRQAAQRRKHRGVRGRICRDRSSREAARTQREPWLLAYSNSLRCAQALQIVQLYKRRMQIEQSFRDLKSARYGCAFRHSLTRKAPRIAVLLLLNALASFVAWMQGLMVTCQNHTTHCEVRIHPKRAHYSVVRIGWESLRRRPPPPPLLEQLSLNSTPTWLAPVLGISA